MPSPQSSAPWNLGWRFSFQEEVAVGSCGKRRVGHRGRLRVAVQRSGKTARSQPTRTGKPRTIRLAASRTAATPCRRRANAGRFPRRWKSDTSSNRPDSFEKYAIHRPSGELQRRVPQDNKIRLHGTAPEWSDTRKLTRNSRDRNLRVAGGRTQNTSDRTTALRWRCS